MPFLSVQFHPEASGGPFDAAFLQIGGGAALAALSGILITVENQALPLYIIMFSTSLAGAIIATIMYFKVRKDGV